MPWGLLVLADCSSSTACNQATDIFVDLPGGTDSISSFEATGACATTLSTICVPVSVSCETGGCDCQVRVQANKTTISMGQTEVCHLRVTAKDGEVFTQDLTFMSPAGSCFSVTGPTAAVHVVFSGAGIFDAGVVRDGGIGDGDGGVGDGDGGAADAADAD